MGVPGSEIDLLKMWREMARYKQLDKNGEIRAVYPNYLRKRTSLCEIYPILRIGFEKGPNADPENGPTETGPLSRDTVKMVTHYYFLWNTDGSQSFVGNNNKPDLEGICH